MANINEECRWWETSWDRVQHFCTGYSIDEGFWYAMTEEQMDLVFYICGYMTEEEFLDKYYYVDNNEESEWEVFNDGEHANPNEI